MTIALTSETPIGEAARCSPELLPVFDRLRLDYCCHGKETIQDACRRAGVDVETLLHAAAASQPASAAPVPAEPQRQSMTALCDEIESTHHAFVRDALDRIQPLMARVVKAHGGTHPQYVKLDSVVNTLREELLDHMVREERVLFPWLRRLDEPSSVHSGPPWSVKRPIDCMVHDHDDVAAAFERIRALTTHYQVPADGCASVASLLLLLQDLERDTRRHIHKENNILFPMGVAAEAARAKPQRCSGSCSCSHEKADVA